MKSILAAFCFILAFAQSCKTPSSASAAVPTSSSITVVSFNSICCGVRSDEFLKNFYETFKQEHNSKLSATKATGCGKEGEYKVMFATGNLSAALQEKFSTGLKSLIENETRTNTGNQQGTVNIEVVDSVDVSFCRGGQQAF